MNIFIIEVHRLISMFMDLEGLCSDLGIDSCLSRRQTRIKAKNRKEAIERTRKRLNLIYKKKFPAHVFDEGCISVHFKLVTENGKIVAKGAVGVPDGRLNLAWVY